MALDAGPQGQLSRAREARDDQGALSGNQPLCTMSHWHGDSRQMPALGHEGESDDDSDSLGSWILAEGPTCTPEGEDRPGPRERQHHGNSRANDSHAPPLEFDDENAEYIWSSDSSLEWDRGPFDYQVPMERPLLHEIYDFERRYPQAASVIRAMLRLPGARRTQRLSDAATRGLQALQEQAAEASHQGVPRADQAVQAVRHIMSEVTRAGEAMSREARRCGADMSATVSRQWPELVRELGEEWLAAVAALTRSAAGEARVADAAAERAPPS